MVELHRRISVERSNFFPAARIAPFVPRHKPFVIHGPNAEKLPDDVKFVEAILDELPKLVNVDPKRVYATGISNGGMMCHRLAREPPPCYYHRNSPAIQFERKQPCERSAAVSCWGWSSVFLLS
jgi:predicted peptidase